MKIKTKTILDKYKDVFDALFDDTFIDKYAVLFDRLIEHNEIKIETYHETNDYICELSLYIDDLPKAANFVFELPCDIMFDLYYRYHILFEYLYDHTTVNVSTRDKQKLFVELLNEIWLKGIPTFSHKHF